MTTLLFGAHDRDNFGDLLLGQVAAALVRDRAPIAAGLAMRDLRAVGGLEVRALAAIAGTAEPAGHTADLIHIGGETLTCSAWQAAVMLLPPTQANAAIGYFETHPAERARWIAETLGTRALAPYVVARSRRRGLRRVVHLGVGGVELARAEPALRAEVLASLREADAIGVRDLRTQAALAAAGIDALLMPDPAVRVAELFGPRIAERAAGGAVAALRDAYPRGYLALQFSAEFGADAMLAPLVDAVEQAAARHGLAVVLFSTGSAPWHDDPLALQRAAQRLQRVPARRFVPRDLWDLCALLAHAAAVVSSSLHARIAATAYARPHAALGGPAAAKQAAWTATWEPEAAPVEPPALAAALEHALAADPAPRAALACALAQRCRTSCAALLGT